jgi:hypothetical protein
MEGGYSRCGLELWVPLIRHDNPRDRDGAPQKKGGRFGRLFNEEERRGVKRTCCFALDHHIGRYDEYVSFFCEWLCLPV